MEQIILEIGKKICLVLSLVIKLALCGKRKVIGPYTTFDITEAPVEILGKLTEQEEQMFDLLLG